MSYDAVLLSGFGGPEGQDDVLPFLRNVTRGRGIPDERLEEVAHRYRAFGGISPINEQNRTLKSALLAALAQAGLDLPVYWGNRNWAPYLDEALEQAAQDGVRTMIAIPTSAYSSYSSCRQYREDWADALEAAGLQQTLRIDKIRQFFSHPGFIQPFIDGVRDGVAAAKQAGHASSAIEVLFSTHSIPTEDAARSGAGLFADVEGGGYAAQHLAVAGAGREPKLHRDLMAARLPSTFRPAVSALARARRQRCAGYPRWPHRRADRATGFRQRPHGGHVGSRYRSA